MRVGAVDIGTNSTRMLVAESTAGGINELERITTVTGLGRGAGPGAGLHDTAISRTCDVLSGYAEAMQSLGVVRVGAVATAAARNAPNRDVFLDAAEAALGTRPEVISGSAEARLAFAGAAQVADDPARALVIDIGGGSTEFVTSTGEQSANIGSVVLTDSHLPDRPASFEQLERASEHAAAILGSLATRTLQGDDPLATLATMENPHEVIGVAGTWTAISAIGLELPRYDRTAVHRSRLSRLSVDRLVVALGALDLQATAAIPSLDPARAPVILGGAIVARECIRLLGAESVLVSEWDLLDGLAAQLLRS